MNTSKPAEKSPSSFGFSLPSKAPKHFFWVLLVGYSLLSIGKFMIPATDRDESRFAQASKQMIESGDYVSINFQDQPRNKKPIGIYWLQAGSTQLMKAVGFAKGNNEIWTYRLPNVIGGFLVLLGFYLLFRGKGLLSEGQSAFTTGLLGTSALFMVESHLAKTDTVLLLCILLQQGFFMRLYLALKENRKPSLRYVYGFWLAMGFGVLIKGPVAPAIFLLTWVTLRFCFKEKVSLKEFKWIPGVLILVLISLPWFVAIQIKSGGAYAAHAIGVDFLPKLIKGQESHGFYPGYYTLLSLLLTWPGSLFILATLGKWRALTDSPLGKFALSWLIPNWILFELVPTKLPHYVLPLFPALFLLTTLALARFGWPQKRWVSIFSKAFFLLVGLLLVCLMGLTTMPLIQVPHYSFFFQIYTGVLFSFIVIYSLTLFGFGASKPVPFFLSLLALWYFGGSILSFMWGYCVLNLGYFLYLPAYFSPSLGIGYMLWVYVTWISQVGSSLFLTPLIIFLLFSLFRKRVNIFFRGRFFEISHAGRPPLTPWLIVIWAVSIYSMLFPSLSFLENLWVSRKATHLRMAEFEPASKLQSVGFNEPSLVFEAGTDIHFVASKEQALNNILENPSMVTLFSIKHSEAWEEGSTVESPSMTWFEEALKGSFPTKLIKKKVFVGYNYSKGKQLVHFLFALEDEKQKNLEEVSS